MKKWLLLSVFGGVGMVSCSPSMPATMDSSRVNVPISSVSLPVGAIKQVLVSPSYGGAAKSFYLPVEARSIAQVIVEKRLGSRTYFVKGISKGQTVGGIVPAYTMDKSGFEVKNDAMMSRAQQAINSQPTYISVK